MRFDRIQGALDADSYVGLALKAAREAISRKKKARGRRDYVQIESERLRIIAAVFSRRLKSLAESFPSLDSLPEFYRELVRATLDYGLLKKSLGAVNWAALSALRLEREYQGKVRRCVDGMQARKHIGAFTGRMSSVARQIEGSLEYLEKSRRVMREYPAVKECFTVAISGFPNVGKSTLLAKLTASKPEIAPYPFTTKTLNLGYFEHRHHLVQVLDTPGTLNRLERMNQIERQAHIAVRHLADLVVFVFDPSLPEERQEQLLQAVRKSGKEVLVYVSKGDIAGEGAVRLAEKHGGLADPEELRRAIGERLLASVKVVRR